VINWVSPCLSFFLSASTAATYIFIAPTCTTIIITLQPYALNDENQHFILRFNKISSLHGVWRWKDAQRQGDFMNNLIYTLILTHPKTFTEGHVHILDKYLHWLGVSAKETIYTSTVEVWNV
jgi:hypothetical protein